MPKSYRIRTQVGIDKHIDVKLEQDFDFLEILSLKINQSDIYIRPCSDYGVIVGRVSVNNGFGIPNAKVSVFIPQTTEDENNPLIADLYPYKTLSDVSEDGYRYNLLPKEPSYSTHAATGTFPTKKEILIDQTQIEIYDKYYKFTTKTNESGDYMIFGVPVGSQTVFLDVDLSDIGCFSLSPQDLIQSGQATEAQVSGSKFKSSTNLNELPQIVTSNRIIDISPLWGEPNICSLGITRCDFDLTQSNNISINPTSVFMGSIISTTDDDALKKNCKPKNNTGNLCELIAGGGSIQAIRQTIFLDEQNLPVLEEYQFEQNGNVIDGDGSYLVNVPMNLDYVITNEFGQQVISNDPNKGIPTKGKYRFKFKWNNEGGLQNQFLRANFLVPNIKEHGWTTSSQDPLNPLNTATFVYTIPIGTLTGTTQALPGSGGLVLENTSNVTDFNIYLNGSLYTGDPNVIPVTGGNIQISANPNDPTLPQSFNFTYYQSDYFDLLRSYTFSLDWDDYVDPQTAINCEDTFYEFNYNKVYTTSMFLDRYKNGIGRARHLGIKEIDNRTCKTTVNTFPVNDIIRNFDFLFFIFNILLSVLAPIILVLLFVAHFISFLWPILKYVLILIALKETYDSVVAGIEAVQTGIQSISAGAGIFSANVGGPIINTGWLLESIRLIGYGVFKIVVAAVKVGFALTFTALAVIAALKIKGFPRIGLPMISYPECNSCDCKCSNAEMEDNFDSQSVQTLVDSNTDNPDTSLASSTSFLAPINLSATYNIDHPNLDQRPLFPPANNNKGWFNDGSGNLPDFGYRSLIALIFDEKIEPGVAAQASIDFKRLFSGWDDTSSPNNLKFKAPQPFVFGADKDTGANDDDRWFANPLSVTYPQKLNDFNTRERYFSGVNRISVTPNPTLPGSGTYQDQSLVLLVRKGTTSNIGIGTVFSFNNPVTSDGNINITGATINQFGLNSVTGTTVTGTTLYSIPFANPSNPTTTSSANINIIQTGSSENYMQYLPDIEYFQVITGMTIGEYETLSESTGVNTNLFHNEYLKHRIFYEVERQSASQVIPIPLGPPYIATTTDDNGDPASKQVTGFIAIEQIPNYQDDYEIVIITRGVDPYTQKQEIKYDLSLLFGYTTTNTVTVTGNYYLNRPIQASTLGPKTHNTVDNSTPTGLYFESFTFTPSNDYSGFTSTNPYYYLSTDDNNMNGFTFGGQNYKTENNAFTVGLLSSTPNILTTLPSILPKGVPQQYFGGDSFIAINTSIGTLTSTSDLYYQFASVDTLGYPFGSTNIIYTMYSAAYYRYTNPGELAGVNFTNKNNIIMRSDRLPTSTCIENGAGSRTGYALHMNNNFCYYGIDGQSSDSTTSFSASLPSGEGLDTDVSGLTQTFTCEDMVSLQCYSGSGTNVTVIPENQCVVPPDRVVEGCYCLLNKKDVDPNEDPALYKFFKKLYLIKGAYSDDARLFLEWKTRFTITFAACRGVFAQTFQNNWVNGVLYMLSFNKTATYSNLTDTTPDYKYCDDVIVFNDLENNFYYRSSPWDGTKFIGKDAPQPNSNWPAVLVNDYPGIGYNTKQIQFPTTVMDLGPREKFITEICNNDNFNSYYVDQVKSTSYQDNSIVIQVGFLSRLLNDNFRQAMIPLTNPAGDNTEGKGIIQFFNSTRQGDRIDGDFAQMLSINSEWRINPFLAENYPNPNSIFFGDDSQSGDGYPRPVFGLFYENNDLDYVYRRNLSPGSEYYNLAPPIFYQYGYPKTQEVPHYKWKLGVDSNYIFGNENNNWDTNVTSTGGFFSKGYQDLDFNSDPYFTTSYFNPQTQQGYIVNFSGSSQPDPIATPSTTQPGESILVGAPYHFYFGLNNGKTAIDKFVKLYIFDPNA